MAVMEPGLAEMMSGGQGQVPAAPQATQQDPMQAIGEIVMMLKQGMTPEELMQQGVPQELIQAAMQMIQEEATQVPQAEAGLASMYTGGQ